MGTVLQADDKLKESAKQIVGGAFGTFGTPIFMGEAFTLGTIAGGPVGGVVLAFVAGTFYAFVVVPKIESGIDSNWEYILLGAEEIGRELSARDF